MSARWMIQEEVRLPRHQPHASPSPPWFIKTAPPLRCVSDQGSTKFQSLKRTLQRISNVLFNLVWLDLLKSTFLPRYFSLQSKRPGLWRAFLTTLPWWLVMFWLDIATSVWHEHAGHPCSWDCWKTFEGTILFSKRKKKKKKEFSSDDLQTSTTLQNSRT